MRISFVNVEKHKVIKEIVSAEIVEFSEFKSTLLMKTCSGDYYSLLAFNKEIEINFNELLTKGYLDLTEDLVISE